MPRPLASLALGVGATLACLGILFPAFGIAVWPGLAGFFIALRVLQGKTLRLLFSGLLFGTLTGGAGCAWFWDTLPLDFLGIHAPLTEGLAVGIIWAYVSLSLGLPVALAAPGLSRLARMRFGPLWIAIAWVLVEHARMWSFALMTWGDGAIIGPNFSAAALGYPLVDIAMLRGWAWPFGVDGLNFGLALLASVLAQEHHGPRKWLTAIPLLLWGVWMPVATAGAGQRNHPALEVAVLATDEPEVLGLSTAEHLRAQLIAIGARRPAVDVILLPEELGQTALFWNAAEARQFFAQHFDGRRVLLVNSQDPAFLGQAVPEGWHHKTLAYTTTDGAALAQYRKRNLMPLGEYVPRLTRAVFAPLRDAALGRHIDSLDRGPRVTSGADLPVAEHDGLRIGALLCSDLFSGDLYRRLMRSGAPDMLVNLSNQFWFHGSRTLHAKTRQIARTHAIEHQRPFLVSNNRAPAFAVDGRGRILAESRWGQAEILYLRMPGAGASK